MMLDTVLSLLTAVGFPGLLITSVTLYVKSRKERRKEPIDNATLIQNMTIRFSETVSEKLLEAETKLKAAEARAEALDNKLEDAMRKIFIYEAEFARRNIALPPVPNSSWQLPPSPPPTP